MADTMICQQMEQLYSGFIRLNSEYEPNTIQIYHMIINFTMILGIGKLESRAKLSQR